MLSEYLQSYARRCKFSHYFKLQLFCRDQVNTEDSNLYMLFLCTVDGVGSEFIPHGKNANPKELKHVYSQLTNCWSQLDLIVVGVYADKGASVFYITDTKLTI